MEAGEEEEEEEEEEEDPSCFGGKRLVLDVQQFVGQCLIKADDAAAAKQQPHVAAAAEAAAVAAAASNSLKMRAKLLTGAPLIRTAAGTSLSPEQQQFLACYQQQIFMAAQFQQSLTGLNQEDFGGGSNTKDQNFIEDEKEIVEANRDGGVNGGGGGGGGSGGCFVPRVLKPRRRRRATTSMPPSSAAAATATTVAAAAAVATETRNVGNTETFNAMSTSSVEVTPEDELRLLPMDLLAEDEDGGGPSKPQLRHSESLQLCRYEQGGADTEERIGVDFSSSPSGPITKPVLRKTSSWAATTTTSSFSLFPQTNDSDLLSSIRDGLSGCSSGVSVGTDNRVTQENAWSSESVRKISASNLEEALKRMDVGAREASFLSRKF